jgi:Ca-activated chloride channel family protein
MRFVRTFAESLNWNRDRAGLALFAYFAAPQLRLTKDPNALFFFLDRLQRRSPFQLEDDPTWNTNIEQAVDWGLRLLETNDRLFGKTNNPKAFVVVSDGQAWSGRVANALADARSAGVAINVVGVGTTAGGFIPQSVEQGVRLSSVHAVIDRASLREIARAGGGDYFELGRESDREIAARIIDSARRKAPVTPREQRREELYWQFLAAAGVVVCLGTLVMRQKAELYWLAVAAVATLLILSV